MCQLILGDTIEIYLTPMYLNKRRDLMNSPTSLSFYVVYEWSLMVVLLLTLQFNPPIVKVVEQMVQ